PHHANTARLATPITRAHPGIRRDALYIVPGCRRGSIADDGNPGAGRLAMAAPIAPFVADQWHGARGAGGARRELIAPGPPPGDSRPWAGASPDSLPMQATRPHLNLAARRGRAARGGPAPARWVRPAESGARRRRG